MELETLRFNLLDNLPNSLKIVLNRPDIQNAFYKEDFNKIYIILSTSKNNYLIIIDKDNDNVLSFIDNVDNIFLNYDNFEQFDYDNIVK